MYSRLRSSLTKRILERGERARILRFASKPSITGRLMSSKIGSGCSSCAFWTASHPSTAKEKLFESASSDSNISTTNSCQGMKSSTTRMFRYGIPNFRILRKLSAGKVAKTISLCLQFMVSRSSLRRRGPAAINRLLWSSESLANQRKTDVSLCLQPEVCPGGFIDHLPRSHDGALSPATAPSDEDRLEAVACGTLPPHASTAEAPRTEKSEPGRARGGT